MNIQTFEYKFDQVRTIEDDKGNIWWVARDICNILGLGNVSQTLLSLDDDEKSDITNTKLDSNNNRLRIINEPGLYNLIFKSRKPEAKEFKRWVTHEVMPSIRKTGSYTARTSQKNNIKEKLGRISQSAGVKKTQRLRLLEVSARIAQMDGNMQEDVIDIYEALLGEFVTEDMTDAISGVRNIINNFVQEMCICSPDEEIWLDVLFEKYQAWCRSKETVSLIKNHFTRYLYEIRNVKPVRRTVFKNKSRKALVGIGLR